MTITHVWSTYGHQFMSTDSEGTESCLRCGALYQLTQREDDPSGGDYTAIDGSDPRPCEGATSRVHGYPSERFCWNHDGGPCEDTEHECNCLLCDS